MNDPRSPPPKPPVPLVGALAMAMADGIRAGRMGAPCAPPADFAQFAREWQKGWDSVKGRSHWPKVNYDWRK